MLLNLQEVRKKMYRKENEINRYVFSFEFPECSALINGERFWDETDIDIWISNYCMIESEL